MKKYKAMVKDKETGKIYFWEGESSSLAEFKEDIYCSAVTCLVAATIKNFDRACDKYYERKEDQSRSSAFRYRFWKEVLGKQARNFIKNAFNYPKAFRWSKLGTGDDILLSTNSADERMYIHPTRRGTLQVEYRCDYTNKKFKVSIDNEWKFDL